MTTYRITSTYFCAAAIVSGDLVIESAPILSWSVGREWSRLRDYANMKGWTIEPLPEQDKAHVSWVDTEEASYEMHWVGKRCLRITKHVEGEQPEDITAEEMPEEVSGLIE